MNSEIWAAFPERRGNLLIFWNELAVSSFKVYFFWTEDTSKHNISYIHILFLFSPPGIWSYTFILETWSLSL